MKLNIKAFALSCGIIWGSSILVLTFWLLILDSNGRIINDLGNIYIGYSLTWLGGVIGMIWGFVDGLISGAFFSWLYNKITEALLKST
jgi:hypothetical protein